MTDTAERIATKTIRRKHGWVTVTARPEGWVIEGESTIRDHKTGYGTFTAEIGRCPCDPEHPGADTYAGTQREPCACKVESHLGGRFCHGWHLPRVERFVEDVARTYGKGLA